MKPPPFRYHRPAEVDEALALLAEVGDDGKVLAGGQSLVPLLNFRLAAPSDLVDVTGLGALGGVEVGADGVTVGAAVRQAALGRHAAAMAASPVVGQALAHVAHGVIRNRGTVVGSLAHGDPAAELVATLAVLGGHVVVASARAGGVARRRIAAADLFAGPMTTSVAPDELVESATFPALAAGQGSAVVELARRHGDYALAGVVALVSADDAGAVTCARLGLFAVAPVPVVLEVGPEAADARALAAVVSGAVDPTDDIHATGVYRRHLVGVLAGRAVAAATADARSRAGAAA